MGASESSFLKGHFEDIELAENTQSHSYAIQRARTKAISTSKESSITTSSGYQSSKTYVLIFSGDKHLMENLKHFSRTIRHPTVLYYMETFSLDTSLTTHVVFENAFPLSQKISVMTPQELIHGIYNILNALMFIHDLCLCSYNNVLITSIFVTVDGEWKLSCLENMSKLTNSSWQVFAQNRIPSHLLPPEDSCEASVSASFGFTRDVYMLGHLLRNEILTSQNLSRYSKTIDPNLYAFKDYAIANLLNQDYKQRPRCSQILKHPVFNNYFTSVINFFHNFLAKSHAERATFLETLYCNTEKLDPKLIVTRILPLLLSDYVICEQSAQKLVADIWNPSVSIKNPKSTKGFMSENMFKEHVVPQFLKLLQSRSIDTRLLLLSHFKPILPYIPKKDISKVLLPKLLTGLRDTNDDIVSLTFHCLGDLVPYLGSSRVVGGSRRCVFVETRPRNQSSISSLSHGGESSYFAEVDETDDTDSENESLTSRGNKKSEKRQSKLKGHRILQVHKKSASESIHRLDPISEKTEDVMASPMTKNLAERAASQEENNYSSSPGSISGQLDTFTDVQLSPVAKHLTSPPPTSLSNQGGTVSQTQKLIAPTQFHFGVHAKKEYSSDASNSSLEAVDNSESYPKSENFLDSCSRGLMRENRLSLSDSNEVVHRRLMTDKPGNEHQRFEYNVEEDCSIDRRNDVTNNDVDRRNDVIMMNEALHEMESGLNEDPPACSGSQDHGGWDDVDWSSD